MPDLGNGKAEHGKGRVPGLVCHTELEPRTNRQGRGFVRLLLTRLGLALDSWATEGSSCWTLPQLRLLDLCLTSPSPTSLSTPTRTAERHYRRRPGPPPSAPRCCRPCPRPRQHRCGHRPGVMIRWVITSGIMAWSSRRSRSRRRLRCGASKRQVPRPARRRPRHHRCRQAHRHRCRRRCRRRRRRRRRFPPRQRCATVMPARAWKATGR